MGLVRLSVVGLIFQKRSRIQGILEIAAENPRQYGILFRAESSGEVHTCD